MKKIRGSSTENSQSEENPNSMKFDRKSTKWRKSELSKENNRSHWKSPCPTIAWVHVTEISNRRYYHVSNYRMGALCLWRTISDNICSHPKYRNSPLQNQHVQSCPILPKLCMSNTRTCRTSGAASRHHVFVMEDAPDHTPDILSYLSGSPWGTSKNPQTRYSTFPAWAKNCVPRHHAGCYHQGYDT